MLTKWSIENKVFEVTSKRVWKDNKNTMKTEKNSRKFKQNSRKTSPTKIIGQFHWILTNFFQFASLYTMFTNRNASKSSRQTSSGISFKKKIRNRKKEINYKFIKVLSPSISSWMFTTECQTNGGQEQTWLKAGKNMLVVKKLGKNLGKTREKLEKSTKKLEKMKTPSSALPVKLSRLFCDRLRNWI